MLRATAYIVLCSARNRLRQRLRRLIEPRYLVGAVVGVGYLIGTLFIRQRAYGAPDRPAPGRRAGGGAAAAAIFGVSGPVAGGVVLALAALVSWLLPFGSGLLDFSRAETAFLFPSPVGRRQLVAYRLCRSQLAVFTGALIMALAYPAGSIFGRLRSLIGVWVLLMTSHVFFTGVTLARASLRRSKAGQLFVWPALALPVAAVVTVLFPVFTAAADAPVNTAAAAVATLGQAAQQGAARVMLWPFALLVRPLFAQTLAEFVGALVGALGVYLVTVAWLIWADASSSDAADASAERHVNQPTSRSRSYVARSLGWAPAHGARPELIFVWKGMLQTWRTVDRWVLGRVLLIVAWAVGASLLVTRARGLTMLMGIFATWGALFAVFMAPQIIRTDLRQDFAQIEWLKTWPLRGAAVIRGEIIWSASVVTMIAWVFGLLAMILSMASSSRIPPPNRAAAWTSFLILTPAVVLAQYTMHNGVAVLFPGWVPLGASRPRGVDAVGQRLILLVATWVGLIVGLAPGLALTAALSWLLRSSIGPWVVPLGAAVTTLLVVMEAILVTEMLGPSFERLDVTSVERAE